MLRSRRTGTFFVALAALLVLVVSCGHSSSERSPANDRASRLSTSKKTDWVRFGFDAARHGVNGEENLLKPRTVGGLHLLWRAKLPEVADSSPVLLHDLPSGGARRDVLYATLKNGSLVALDASSGRTLWTRKTSGPQFTTSSPVADPAKRLIFSYGLDGKIHRYDAASGDERAGGGWPARVTTMPETEKGSSALNISGGYVYMTTSGYPGDAPPYQGHVVAVNESTGRESVFNSLCSGKRHLLSRGECSSNLSGIWGRGGALLDPETNSVLTTSGNGPYNPNKGDYSDSVLKLGRKDLRLLDSYTPRTYQKLEQQDADLSSDSPAPLPKLSGSRWPYLMLQGGKDGKLRLLDRRNLSGKGGPGHLGGALEVVNSAACATFTQPVNWKEGGEVHVVVAGTCGTAAYRLAEAGGRPRLELLWKKGYKTTTPVLAGGVLFAAGDGKVVALDPRSGHLLWSSEQKSAGGTVGKIHWQSPIVVNGRLYVGDESGEIVAYGLPK